MLRVAFVFFNDPPTPFNSSVAALAGAVRGAGHEVRAVSIPLAGSVEAAAARVDALGADVVAISAMTRDWPAARAVLECVRPGPFRVVGGYHASLAPHDVAASTAVDAIGIGDGERPLVALLHALDASQTPRTRPGLWVRGAKGFDGAPPGPDPVLDIDALPWWDYDALGDVSEMLDYGINTFGALADRFLPTRASRGCPHQCSYCSAPVWGKTTGFATREARNVRPVESLCDELAMLRDRHAPDGYEFWDEHFPVNMQWLRALAREYPARVGLPFKVEMHPNAASRDRLQALADAGCVLFHCGVEAGDPTLRRQTLNRRSSDETLVRVFEDARAVGLRTSASVMTALPGETYAQAHATVELLERLQPDSFMWSTYMALPFTPLGDRARGAWPGPVTSLDERPYTPRRMPSAMSEDERAQIHRELAALQARLLDRAIGDDGSARPRRVAVPGPRPSTALDVQAVASALDVQTVAAVLGVSGADATGPRMQRAWYEGEEVLAELDFPDHGTWVLVIGHADGSPAYVVRGGLRFSYRGSDAPAVLLRLLEDLAARADSIASAAWLRRPSL